MLSIRTPKEFVSLVPSKKFKKSSTSCFKSKITALLKEFLRQMAKSTLIIMGTTECNQSKS